MAKNYWAQVNAASTLAEIAAAESALRADASLSGAEFDDYMMALAYLTRECYAQ